MSRQLALCERQSQIMEIVYSLGEVSIAQIQSRMPDQLSLSTLRTLLRNLKENGYLTSRQEGRQHIFSRTVPKQNVGLAELRRVLHVFFGGSMDQALASYTAETERQLGEVDLQKTRSSEDLVPFKYATNAQSAITMREKEVLRLLTEGHTTKNIADRLYISPRTVEAHRWNLTKKLGINSLAELTKYAIREQLTSYQ